MRSLINSMSDPTLQTEYTAIRNGGAGLIDLSSRGRILVSGAEVVMFLNGLITNDMKTLAVNSWMPAVFPNVQGRLLAAVRVIHRDDGFLIDTESVTHDTVLKLLERFTLAGIRDQIRSLGADGMEIGASFPNNEKNHTTARAVLIVLWKLATDRVVSPDASKEMMALLAHSPLHSVPPVSPVVASPSNPAAPAGVPVAVRDAVAIFGARSYVLVIQVQGLRDNFESAELIAKISSALTKVM